MRNGLVGCLGALVLASTMASAGCGASGDGTGGSGGTSPGSGGTQTGGGGSGGDSVTSLSGATSLGALSEAEAAQLCDDTYAYFRNAISTATNCKWKGLSFATSSSAPTEEQLQANCTEKESGCLADPAAALANNPGCSPFPDNCMATVSDYSRCIKDQVDVFEQTVAAIADCDVLTGTGTDAVWAALGADPPASCTFPTCTGLYPPNPLF
jgi:hypothetical protein